MKYLILWSLPWLLFTQLACIWDRDTLAAEMEGRADVVKILGGWFDRNPPEYFQMRLERVSAELTENPEQLDLYDDAAVACDRLGKPDEAIAWMEKKQQFLQLEPENAPQPNHHYRTLANLGTFYAHRWIKARKENPDTEVDFADLEQAEKLIAEAIELNPDAHFGREKYQLLVIQWLQSEVTKYDEELENPLEKLILGFHRETEDRGLLKDLGIEDAVEGLSGLIELGAGWESPDLMTILTYALQAEGRSHPALMAGERLSELVDAGKQSLRPNFFDEVPFRFAGLIEEPQATKDYFAKLRAAANERHQQRTDYMLSRLERGEHPDTHPDFWNEWQEPKAPTWQFSAQSRVINLTTMLILTSFFLVSVLFVVVIRRFTKS